MNLLPESFKNKMKDLLKEEYDAFLASYDNKHNSGIRVNTLKLTPEEFKARAAFDIRPVPWIKNGFFYDAEDAVSKHPYYYAGLYYIQEPSAMTPASLLPVEPGHRVLDLCAAPGGKSTELGARLCGKGVLVANDISNSRAKALLKNIELFGISNPVVISEEPSKLAGRFEGYFDRILVDAPCSGEGMFRKAHAVIKNWEQYGVGYYAKLQREILPQAIKMLRPGGYLLYSTCTFSVEEDEGTIDFILNNFPDMHIEKVIDFDSEPYRGFAHGLPEYCGGRAEAAETIRIYPHRVMGEGHYTALLKKDEGSGYVAPEASVKPYKVPDEAKSFLDRLNMDIDYSRVICKEQRLYMLPEGLPDMKGLRVMRSGLLLGELKGSGNNVRFEPSQALACTLSVKSFDNVYDIPSDCEDVRKYLKCESIAAGEKVKDGWVLVCTDGFALGWGKAAGGMIKNKYLPGWRLM